MTKSQASDKKIPCSSQDCDKVFGREPDMRRHFAATHANIRYYCADPNCSYSSKRQHRVNHHYQNFHAEVFNLPIYVPGSEERPQQQASLGGTSMNGQHGGELSSTSMNFPITPQFPTYSSSSSSITSYSPQTMGSVKHPWTSAGAGNYTTQTPHPGQSYQLSAHNQSGSGDNTGSLEQGEIWHQSDEPVNGQSSQCYGYGGSKD